jgi:hypothetical protein
MGHVEIGRATGDGREVHVIVGVAVRHADRNVAATEGTASHGERR